MESEIAGSEAAVHGGVTQCPVDVGATAQNRQFDGGAIFWMIAFGADRGGFFEPTPAPGPSAKNVCSDAVRARIR